MEQGLSRFLFYLKQINQLLDKAGGQKNPALWLFSNNARTPFFMLEALARIYAKMHNPKMFDKLKDKFKLIEDSLGQIDYYNSLSISFAGNRLIKSEYTKYIKIQLDQSISFMNEVLVENKWLLNDRERIIKISKKLNEADWLTPEKEMKLVSDIYKSSVASINRFAAETKFRFDNVEEDVHELRRRLRWLSIYPQAFRGAIQYSNGFKSNPHLKKYLTDEIINSPYNKFPPVGNNTALVLVEKDYFLALSWIIAKLGTLKDEGLLLTGLCEAIKYRSKKPGKEIMAEAEILLGMEQRSMQVILDEAGAITKKFFEENNLEHLIS